MHSQVHVAAQCVLNAIELPKFIPFAASSPISIIPPTIKQQIRLPVHDILFADGCDTGVVQVQPGPSSPAATYVCGIVPHCRCPPMVLNNGQEIVHSPAARGGTALCQHARFELQHRPV
eukprot:scaffold150177_cov52-Prasinocladus_malaysianus.AAC.1